MESVTLCVWQGMVYVEVVSENGTCYPVCVAGSGICGGGGNPHLPGLGPTPGNQF